MKRSVAVATETDELGPCEPGTNVHFDGIVWQETKEGMLILNVSWRGRTYVGALMDATNHAWAPPRLKPLNAKSKSSLSNSLDTIGNNIGERKLRNGKVTYKVNGLSTSAITTTATATSDNGKATNSCHGSAATSFPATGADSNSSPAATPAESMPNGTSHGQQAASGAQSKSLLLQCTEIGCFKKFKGTDGLEYHRNFAHNNNSKALPPPSHLAPSSLVSASNYSETSHNFGGTANETCLQPSHATTMTAATAATSESSASHSLLSEVSISNGQLKHAKYDINEMVASHSHQPFYQPLSTSATATSVARSSPVVGAATSTNVSKSESSSPAKKVNVIKIGKQQQQQHQQMQATANGQAKHGPYTSSSSSSSSSSISEQSKERPHQPSSKANNKSKSSLSGNSKTFTNGNVSHHSPSDTTTQQQQQQRQQQQQQQQQKLPLSMSAATSAAIAAASRGALSSH